MLKRYFLFFSFLIVIFSQCIPAEEEVLTEVNFDISKPEFQKFYDLQDKQLMDSLLAYVGHKDPSYRYGAAMAFASIQDSSVVDSLIKLLEDDVEKVRVAAAYAIGQLRSSKGEKWLIKNFEAYDSLGIHKELNATILEAVGKCGSIKSLLLMSTAPYYVTTDTLLLEGMARGIYRFGLRGIKSAEATERIVNFLIEKKYPSEVRMMAANYLYRIKDVKIDSFIPPLLEELRVEKDPRVRMALAIGLGKTNSPEVLDALIELLGREKDYRVKCNIITALQNFKYRKVVSAIVPLVSDENIQVATTAANYFLIKGIPQAAPQYRQIVRRNDSLAWQVKSILYQAANRHLSLYSEGTRLALQYELRDQFQNATDPYQKAAALRALGEYGRNYRNIYESGFKSNSPIIRTTCVEALASIISNPKFDATFGISRRRVKAELGAYFKEALEKGDAAMMAVAANVIRQSTLDFKSVYDTLTFLQTAKNRLELPKEIETLYEVLKTIDYFAGKNPSETALPQAAFKHPINWRVFNTIDDDSKAAIRTSKGTFVLKFFPDKAPGSVANFVSLAKSGFFAGKSFHRVIPNFVAQGGCPRGDGYGSLGYTIRSEVPPMYYDEEGYLGMASAGKHTEGTQWFVTYAPTPHLDGRYTIFAKVIDGMDVVHKLSVSDRIQQVEIVE
ncbi:MAG: peptidylprolyl isomerase [Bacteroidota bacterium]